MSASPSVDPRLVRFAARMLDRLSPDSLAELVRDLRDHPGNTIAGAALALATRAPRWAAEAAVEEAFRLRGRQ